jgi:hypothetical protein
VHWQLNAPRQYDTEIHKLHLIQNGTEGSAAQTWLSRSISQRGAAGAREHVASLPDEEQLHCSVCKMVHLVTIFTLYGANTCLPDDAYVIPQNAARRLL